MLKDIFKFVEKENSFEAVDLDLNTIDITKLKLLVKAHEKEIYELDEHSIIAKPHADNHGVYPFSKMDFLSHKLLEMIFPANVPKLIAASFEDESNPFFILEKIDIDPLHKAYNVSRQRVHQKEGLSYTYDKDFLSVEEEEIESHTKLHFEKVEQIKIDYKNNLKDYGITFDHSQVNITWHDNNPVALELHKCQRDYLFDYNTCKKYFNGLNELNSIKEKGIEILRRLAELEKTTPKEITD